MPNLRREIEDNGWHWSKTYATSHATKWSCAAFLTGRFYTEVFDSETGAATSGQHLASVLSDHGYTTGAFIAGNPNVNEYLPPFDESWNGGYDQMNHKSGPRVFTSRVSKLLRANKEFPADNVLSRAREWYMNQAGPCFLWIHLMEPHQPYLPGFRRAFSEGLLKTYQSVISQYRRNGDLTSQELKRLETLYWETVRALDDSIVDHLDWLSNDNVFLFSADHGESFSRGRAGHHGWGDDVMMVPVLSNHTIEELPDLRNVPERLLSMGDLPTPDVMRPAICTEDSIHPAFGGAGTPTLVVLSEEQNIKEELTSVDGSLEYLGAHTGKTIEAP
ncbi:MAG: sulfatase-like hydrolase/transferase, partial [Halobacteriaceae archaeon]